MYLNLIINRRIYCIFCPIILSVGYSSNLIRCTGMRDIFWCEIYLGRMRNGRGLSVLSASTATATVPSFRRYSVTDRSSDALLCGCTKWIANRAWWRLDWLSPFRVIGIEMGYLVTGMWYGNCGQFMNGRVQREQLFQNRKLVAV